MAEDTTTTPARHTTIYGLADPREGELRVRYVGKTIVRPSTRLSQHVSAALVSRFDYPVARWIRKLDAVGLRPVQIILEEGVPLDDWVERESHWISYYRSIGPMLNCTDGGEGMVGHIPSAETRRAMSVAHTGRKHTPEARVRMSEAQRSYEHKPRSPEGLAAVRAGHAKRSASLTPEVRASFASFLGRKHTEETKAKIKLQAGWKHTDETKQKLSDMKTGKPIHSQESRERISRQFSNIKHSPEHIEKRISARIATVNARKAEKAALAVVKSAAPSANDNITFDTTTYTTQGTLF